MRMPARLKSSIVDSCRLPLGMPSFSLFMNVSFEGYGKILAGSRASTAGTHPERVVGRAHDGARATEAMPAWTISTAKDPNVLTIGPAGEYAMGSRYGSKIWPGLHPVFKNVSRNRVVSVAVRRR
jgi:hypothetical protein